jgi:ribonuclease P protein component
VPAEFRRHQRLLTASDFRRVFSAPDVKSGQSEVLLLARANDKTAHRLGLAIAKKHLPLAVQRNLMKRLARETFRAMDPSSPCLDIVVLSRPAARAAERKALRNALNEQFVRLTARAKRTLADSASPRTPAAHR